MSIITWDEGLIDQDLMYHSVCRNYWMIIYSITFISRKATVHRSIANIIKYSTFFGKISVSLRLVFCCLRAFVITLFAFGGHFPICHMTDANFMHIKQLVYILQFLKFSLKAETYKSDDCSLTHAITFIFILKITESEYIIIAVLTQQIFLLNQKKFRKRICWKQRILSSKDHNLI